MDPGSAWQPMSERVHLVPQVQSTSAAHLSPICQWGQATDMAIDCLLWYNAPQQIAAIVSNALFCAGQKWMSSHSKYSHMICLDLFTLWNTTFLENNKFHFDALKQLLPFMLLAHHNSHFINKGFEICIEMECPWYWWWYTQLYNRHMWDMMTYSIL